MRIVWVMVLLHVHDIGHVTICVTVPARMPVYLPPQVLATLHLTYESLNPEDERAIDVGVLVGMALILKLAFAFMLWREVRSSDAPTEG